MEPIQFENTTIYQIMVGRAIVKDFAKYQANTFFRNRVIRKPMTSPWVELPGTYETAPRIACIQDGTEVKFKEGEYKVSALANGDDEETIRFWFGQSKAGVIYYAARSRPANDHRAKRSDF